MTTTATIDLSFRIIREDGKPGTLADARTLDAHLNDDGDTLSLEGGRFILDDVRWDTPQCFLGHLEVSFEVQVEAYEGDDISPEALVAEAYEAAILHLPEGYDVAKLTATLA